MSVSVASDFEPLLSFAGEVPESAGRTPIGLTLALDADNHRRVECVTL